MIGDYSSIESTVTVCPNLPDCNAGCGDGYFLREDMEPRIGRILRITTSTRTELRQSSDRLCLDENQLLRQESQSTVPLTNCRCPRALQKRI